MKFAVRWLVLLSFITLSSCSGGGGSSEGNNSSPGTVVKGGISETQVEISKMNDLLNKDQNYELELSDVKELKSKGLINDSEYTQLLALVSQQ